MIARIVGDVLTPESIVLEAPYGRFHVNRMDGIDHAGMRAKQLREVLILMSDADKPHLMLRLAKQLGGEVVDRTKVAIADYLNSEGLSAASLFASELSDFLRLIELEDDADMVIWLARQLCDELSGTLAGMAQARGAGGEVGACVDGRGWAKVLSGAKPDSKRDVLAWHDVNHMPLPAFYNEENNCWFSKLDGRKFADGAVTHWCEIDPPEGVAI